MRRASDRARRNVDLAWISLGISDELGDRLGRNRWMHHHHVGHDNRAGDRRDVTDKIETKLFVQRSIDRVCRGDQEECVAIGGGTPRRPRGGITSPPPPALRNEMPAPPRPCPLSPQPPPH